jgi:tight adherence protein B
MRTLLLALCGLGIGAGICLAYAVRNPAPPAARTERSASLLPLRRLALAVVCAGIAYAVTGWIASLPIASAGAWFLPAMLGTDDDQEHELAVIDAIAGFAEMLRDTLKAASGLNQALTLACRHAPAALQPAAAELAERIEARDGTTRQALRVFADDIGDATCDLVSLALAAASEHPTRDLAGLLSSLATTAREQAAMRSRTAVAQAGTRTAMRIITAATLGLSAILLVIDRAYLANYSSPLGQIILLAVAGIFALGLSWLKSLARTPRPARLWTHPSEATS